MPHSISHLIEVATPPGTVHPLLVTARGLSQWWAEDIVGPDATGALELGFFQRATIYRLEPQALGDTRVAWACTTGKEWQGTGIEFLLETAGKDTRVRLTHSGWQEATDYFISCNTTWGVLMVRLKAAAEGRALGPLFLRTGMAY